MGWTELINVEDLPEDYQLVVKAIGLENTIKLANAMKKVHLYLKDPDRFLFPVKKRYVLQLFKEAGPGQPFNYRRVALETGLSERCIYEIIEETREKPKQCDFFD